MRTIVAFAALLMSVVLAGCGTGEPNSLFDVAGYHVRDGAVYYLNAFPGKAFAVDGADAGSFEVLDRSFARDRHAVYLDGRSLADADPATFRLLDRSGYAADAHRVYLRDQVISTDPEHFELLDGDLSRDGVAVYWPDGSVLSDDPEHFAVISNTNHYLFTRDSDRVHVNGNPVAGADPRTFRVIGGAYAVDGVRAFYFDGAVAGADALSLRHLEGAYAADGRAAYWMGQVIDGADPVTFRVLSAALECSADATRAYHRRDVIRGAAPGAFPPDRPVTGCSTERITFAD